MPKSFYIVAHTRKLHIGKHGAGIDRYGGPALCNMHGQFGWTDATEHEIRAYDVCKVCTRVLEVLDGRTGT